MPDHAHLGARELELLDPPRRRLRHLPVRLVVDAANTLRSGKQTRVVRQTKRSFDVANYFTGPREGGGNNDIGSTVTRP